MKTGIVSAAEVRETGSLLARDYLLDAEYEARKVLRDWNRSHANVIDMRSRAGTELICKLEAALSRAYDMGRRRA
jgi:hypothetical protein